MSTRPPEPDGVEPQVPAPPGAPTTPYGPGPYPPAAPAPAPAPAPQHSPAPAPGAFPVGPYAPGQYTPGPYAPGGYAPGPYGQPVGSVPAQPHHLGPQAPWSHGQQWYLPPGATYPMQLPVRRRTDRLTATIGWGMLALAVLTVVASLLPWGTVHVVDLSGSAHTCTIRGWQDIRCGSFVDDYDYGTGSILFACVVGVMGTLRGLIRRGGLALAAGIVTIVMAVLTALVIAGGTSVDPDPLATVTFSTSAGLWLTMVLAVGMLALGIWGTVKHR